MWIYIVPEVQKNENERIQCPVCKNSVTVLSYNQHIQTKVHKSASDKYYKDRIDFENYRLYSSSFSDTIVQFLSSVEQDFTVLSTHLLLVHSAVLLDINYSALYHEEIADDKNKNIAEVKDFHIHKKVTLIFR